MIHSKQHISDLVEICYRKGIRHVVIAPGSRNAPLINAFSKRYEDQCISIVDERSAGYFALGISRFSGKPAVVICTSGTAVLNLGPSIAEAFYQHIPLLAITADRPAEWIGQQDNQTIRQTHVFKDNCKASYQLPRLCADKDELWYAHRLVNEAVNASVHGVPGPVHINVPLAEPLYEKLPECPEDLPVIEQPVSTIHIDLPEDLVTEWKKSQRILIIHGQDVHNNKVEKSLRLLSDDPGIVILAENIANISGATIDTPDLFFARSGTDEIEQPDLILYSGGQVVSKLLKKYIRELKDIQLWRIGEESQIIDTYQKTTKIIPYLAQDVYRALSFITRTWDNPDFHSQWEAKILNIKHVRNKELKNIPFSDLKAFEIILKRLPEHSHLDLGNSSVIRYSHLFDSRNDISYFSNRGVSGIDGSLSSASGTAFASGITSTAIVGDLGFVYDSNALWNRKLSANLNIIVINNQGGGIFSLIDGPTSSPVYKDLFNAYHPVDIQKLAEAFGLHYFCAEDPEKLNDSLDKMYTLSDKACLLEVKTREEVNSPLYRQVLGKK